MAWSKVSRHERGYGTAWDKLRKVIIARDKGLCQEHRRDGKLRTGNNVDHILSKAKGGTDDPSNLELLCADCHKAKTAKDNGQNISPIKHISVADWLANG